MKSALNRPAGYAAAFILAALGTVGGAVAPVQAAQEQEDYAVPSFTWNGSACESFTKTGASGDASACASLVKKWTADLSAKTVREMSQGEGQAGVTNPLFGLKAIPITQACKGVAALPEDTSLAQVVTASDNCMRVAYVTSQNFTEMSGQEIESFGRALGKIAAKISTLTLR